MFCQAYNDFLVDWCGEEPGRLFGAALLPVQDPARTAKEIHRAAELGHPVGLIRPIDAQAKYPNEVAPSMMAAGAPTTRCSGRSRRPGWCSGMHTFPAPSYPHPLGPDYLASPGELFTRAGTDSQTFSFIHEMQVWLSQVLLTGLLDRYPQAQDGRVRVQRGVAALHAGDLRPALQAVRQRARAHARTACRPRRSTSSA